jgi:hypothetical protein
VGSAWAVARSGSRVCLQGPGVGFTSSALTVVFGNKRPIDNKPMTTMPVIRIIIFVFISSSRFADIYRWFDLVTSQSSLKDMMHM